MLANSQQSIDNILKSSEHIEEFKHQLAIILENHKDKIAQTAGERRLEDEKLMSVWRALFEYGQIAIRTVILSNGAGATAIIAYLGKSNESHTQGQLDLAAGIFAFGVASGFLATIFAYLSQFQLARIAVLTKTPIVPGTRWERQAGLICVFAGLVAFLVGVGVAVQSF